MVKWWRPQIETDNLNDADQIEHEKKSQEDYKLDKYDYQKVQRAMQTLIDEFDCEVKKTQLKLDNNGVQ